MFLTDDAEAVVTARRLRYMGEDPLDVDPEVGRRYWAYGLGCNYRPQELPFAFARSQLKRLDHYNEIAQRNAQMLTDALREIPGMVPPEVPEGRESVWYIYRVRLDPRELGWDGRDAELRDRVIAALRAEGVHATLWQYHPLPAFTAFRRRELRPWTPDADREELRSWDPAEYPVASQICDQSFVLGSGVTPLAGQSEELARSYVEAIRKVMGRIGEVMEMDFRSPTDSLAAEALDRSHGIQGEPALVPV
jgi:perosamine synthetase